MKPNQAAPGFSSFCLQFRESSSSSTYISQDSITVKGLIDINIDAYLLLAVFHVLNCQYIETFPYFVDGGPLFQFLD